MESSVSVRKWWGLTALHWPADLIFWGLWLLLNSLLFLPAYLMTQESSTFLPLTSLRQGFASLLSDAFVARPNYDLFRINAELWIFATLWLFVAPLRRAPVRWAFNLIYLLAVVYAVYEGIMVFTFYMEPIFYSQSHMILAGVPFLLEHIHLPWPAYVGLGALLLAFFGAVFVMIRLLTEQARPDRLSRASQGILLAGCGLILVVAVPLHANLAALETVTGSFFSKVVANVSGSLDIYQQVQDYDDGDIFDVYDYGDKELASHPNIYMIFIESYGSVLYKRKDWEPAYRAVLSDLEAELREAGWAVASALSESPVWGGGSWMSYTSALFGLRIDNDARYLSLFDTYQERDYPDIASYLRGQGYEFAWLTAISTELKEEKWLPYQRFYNIDRWLRFKDLNYVGPMVSWGPAPLDQYSFNYARELVYDEAESPVLFYAITQNSHYPWYELPELAGDWRDVNDPDYPQPNAPPELIEHEAKRQNYFNAIHYDLKVLTDFILNEPEEDSIFILVGDHQPPQVSRRADGWETPIHIVSRNTEFVESFLDYGFEPSLQVEVVEPVMRHEGLYSLLVRQLLQFYGEEDVELPAYLPDGASYEEELLEEMPAKSK